MGFRNAIKEAYKQEQTVTKDGIHTVDLHKRNTANKANSDSFKKSFRYCGKVQKQGQWPAGQNLQ